MSRPLRIEFPGAVYHVTARGDRRESIFVDDQDRVALLAIVEQGLERFDATVLAYCLMGNHDHFVVHTRCANLSLLMRHINGVYSQRFNRLHGLVGHLLQGRFKAILVDRDAYLVEVCRYVEINPVRAFLGDDGFVERMHALMAPTHKTAQTIPLRQRSAPKGLLDWLRECSSREEALWMAHTRSGLRMTVLAAELGLSVARVSQFIARQEAQIKAGRGLAAA